VVAHDLDKVQHLERAGELEADNVLAICAHVCVMRIQSIPISSVKSSSVKSQDHLTNVA
jgi:hypothetical protein